MFLKKLAPKDMIVLGCLVILTAIVGVYLIALADNDNVIRISLGDGAAKEVSFERLSLSPGDSEKYTLQFDYEEFVPYDITLDFKETVNRDLKKYVWVKVQGNGEVFCDMLLSDAFKQGKLHIDVDPADGGSGAIDIIFYMPLGVGNEAQSAGSSFKLLVKASSEKPLEGEEE